MLCLCRSVPKSKISNTAETSIPPSLLLRLAWQGFYNSIHYNWPNRQITCPGGDQAQADDRWAAMEGALGLGGGGGGGNACSCNGEDQFHGRNVPDGLQRMLRKPL